MKRSILIIGGMGPQASLCLHQKIIARATTEGAISGEDFPEIIHLSLPIPDFISDQSQIPKALRQLKQLLQCLWQR